MNNIVVTKNFVNFVTKNFVTKNFVTSKTLIMNPFKFGTVVEDEFFTDRKEELQTVKEIMDSENHLVLISPRRYGKSSLINKALNELRRPYILIDMMQVLSVENLAVHIMRGIFKIYTMEKLKHLISQFRIMPTISYNPVTGSWDISVSTSTKGDSASILLEDAMDLLQKVTSNEDRLIVVLDEFQEVVEIAHGLDKQLRAIMQRQKGLNYIFMGSQESMMTDIFEKKKSPFYHFGERMTLRKIPKEDFYRYIMERLPSDDPEYCSDVAEQILAFTNVHPYYSQQLASVVYRRMKYNNEHDDIVENSVKIIVQEHDLDYERLWQSMNRSERRVMIGLCHGVNPLQDRSYAYSTTSSILRKLVKSGYVVNNNGYEIEDPFFAQWLLGKTVSASGI